MAVSDYWPGSTTFPYTCPHGTWYGFACMQCSLPAANMVTWTTPAQGWQCPVCTRVMSPTSPGWLYCIHPLQAVEAPDSGETAEYAPTIILPAEMARDGYVRTAELGREWREVIPGIEARVTGVRAGDGEIRSDVDLRLAPGGGQAHD